MNGDISEYLRVETVDSLKSEHVLAWCKKGKDPSAFVNLIPDDSSIFRLELIKKVLKWKKDESRLLKYVVHPPHVPFTMDLIFKRKAFKVLVQICSKENRDKAFILFDIHSVSIALRHDIKILIQEYKYLYAFNALASLNILLTYPDVLSEVIIPLIVKGKLEMVTRELNVELRVSLFKSLDQAYESNSDKLNSQDISLQHFFTPKEINKIIVRLFKFWNYGEDRYEELAPNFFLNKLEGALYYYIKSKKDFRLNDWRDIITYNIDKYPILRSSAKEAIGNKFFKDEDEIKYWNSKYGWDLSYNKLITRRKTPVRNVKYLTPDINLNNIIFVTSKNYKEFLQSLLHRKLITGYDSEFFEDFGSFKSKVALIQIAIDEKIYILDMVELVEYEDFLISFVNHYFLNNEVTILGYGIISDFQALAWTHVIFEKLEMNATVLDLQDTAHFLKNVLLIDYKEYNSKLKGLAGLVESIFGEPLDKTYQRSFWIRRPLLHDQLVYAALDASILLRLFNHLLDVSFEERDHPNYKNYFGNVRNRVPESSGNFICETSYTSSKKPKKRNRKKKRNSVNTENNGALLCESSSESSSLRFVCNNMLHGLAKKLRAYGIDTLYIETTNPELLADAALNSKRVILSRGKIVDRIASSRSDVFVYNVISNKAQDQVKEVIKKFDISVGEEDIFKRCVLCNSDQYIVISQSEMIFLSHCQISSSRREIIIGEVHKIALPSLTTSSGVHLKISDIPDSITNTMDTFYICSSCGHVYWKGSHWDKVKEKCSNLR